jgi:hypothetical protein
MIAFGRRMTDNENTTDLEPRGRTEQRIGEWEMPIYGITGPSVARWAAQQAMAAAMALGSSSADCKGASMGVSTIVSREAKTFSDSMAQHAGAIGPQAGVWNPEQYSMTTEI